MKEKYNLGLNMDFVMENVEDVLLYFLGDVL